MDCYSPLVGDVCLGRYAYDPPHDVRPAAGGRHTRREPAGLAHRMELAMVTPSDRMFAAARDAADAVARREMERDLAWAEHLRDALLIIEDDDEPERDD